MIRIKLSTPDGSRPAYIDFPTEVQEIKLRHFTEYEAAYSRVTELYAKYEDEKISYPDFVYQYVLSILDCVRAFDLKGVEDAAFGDLRAHLSGLNESGELDLEGTEQTVLTIYSNVFKVVEKYMTSRRTDWGDDYKFRYQGREYVIPGGYLEPATGVFRFHGFTDAQVVESLEIWRMYEKFKGGDPKGNYLFTAILHIIACYALHPDEQFPDDDLAIERFLAERVNHFQNIPLNIGLDILGFFLHIKKQSKETRD